MSCKVNRNSKGEIESVLAPNGQESKLYATFAKANGPELGLKYYALALSYLENPITAKEIKLDKNGDPTVKSFNTVYQDKYDIYNLDSDMVFSIEQNGQVTDAYEGTAYSDQYVKNMRNAITKLSNRRIALVEDIKAEEDVDIKAYKLSILNKVESLMSLLKSDAVDIATGTPDTGKISIKTIYDRGKEQISELRNLFVRSRENIELEEIEIISEAVRFWALAAQFQSATNPIASDEDTKADPAVQAALRELEIDATNLFTEIAKARVDKFVQRVNDDNFLNEDKDVTAAMVRAAESDINLLEQQLLNPAEWDRILPQISAVITRKMHFEAIQKSHVALKDFGELVKKANATETGGEPYQEIDKDGNPTGNLISEYSKEFYDLQEALDQKLKRDEFVKAQKKLQNASHILRLDQLEIMLDKSSGPEYEAAKKLWEESKKPFIQEFGAEKVEAMEKGFRKDIEDHINMRIVEIDGVIDEEEDRRKKEGLPPLPYDVLKDKNMRRKIIDIRQRYSYNSPAAYTRHLFFEPNKGIKVVYPSKGPRAIIPKDKSYRNERFERLNDDQKALLYAMRKITKEAADSAPYIRNKENFFPYITQQMIESMALGLKFQFNPRKLAEQMRKIMTAARKDPRDTEIDEQGLIVPAVRAMDFKVPEKEIEDMIEYELAKAANQGEEITRVEAEERAMKRVEAKRSWDIAGVMGYYIMQNELFKSRAKHDNLMRMTYRLALEKENLVTNNFGEEIMKQGKPLAGGKSVKMVYAMQTLALQDYYGMNMKNEIRGTGKNLLSKEDKEKKKQLETRQEALNKEVENLRLEVGKETDIIKKAVLQEDLTALELQLSKINDQISELGDELTVAGLFRGAIFYNQLRGMGWNVFSATSTLLYGRMTNSVMAGRYYTPRALKEATDIISASVRMRFKSDPAEGTKVYDVMKARSLNHIYSFVDAPVDIQSKLGTKPEFKKTLKDKIDPMALQEGAEYQVQMPILVAVLKDKTVEVTLPDGKKATKQYWECFDSNGAWKYDQQSFDTFFPVFDEAKQITKLVHGNYDPNSSLFIKQHVLGDALLQFRRWAIAAFMDRFGSEKDMHNLTGKFKGRYRSWGNLVQRAFAQELENAPNGQGVWLRLLKQFMISFLAATPLIKRTAFNFGNVKDGIVDMSDFITEDFTEADMKNMISNMHELAFLAMVLLLGKGLMGLRDDEDEDSMARAVYNFAINQVYRMERDITMWADPRAFEKTFSTSLPIMSLITSGWKLTSALGTGLYSGEWEIENGMYAGDNRLRRAIFGVLPGFAQGQRFDDTMSGLVERGR